MIKFNAQQQIKELAQSSTKLKCLRTFLSGYDVLVTTDEDMGAAPFIFNGIYSLNEVINYEILKRIYPNRIYSLNITSEDYIDIVYITDKQQYVVIY